MNPEKKTSVHIDWVRIRAIIQSRHSTKRVPRNDK